MPRQSPDPACSGLGFSVFFCQQIQDIRRFDLAFDNRRRRFDNCVFTLSFYRAAVFDDLVRLSGTRLIPIRDRRRRFLDCIRRWFGTRFRRRHHCGRRGLRCRQTEQAAGELRDDLAKIAEAVFGIILAIEAGLMGR